MKNPLENSYSLDIETTGLDPEENRITAIGLCENNVEGSEAKMEFIDSPEHEEEGLKWLSNQLDKLNPKTVVTWRPFDSNFITTRANMLDVPNPLEKVEHFDLHQWIKENEYGGEEVHLEEVLSDQGLEGKHLPGRLMPTLYQSYIQFGNEEDREKIINHCRRDIGAMVEIMDQFRNELLK